jgi:hypothetical protein
MMTTATIMIMRTTITTTSMLTNTRTIDVRP